MRFLPTAGILALAACMLQCSKKLTCEKFSVQAGERYGYSSFKHPNDTARWAGCSDGKTRTLRCTTAHWSNWKCFCSVDNSDKLQARTETAFPPDRAGATAFANKTCDWKIE
ncbi:MAG: hypothetical protein J0L53_19775 [Spirochaetes bacterium]|nr:hypothetical protein [Spirochaetota bacterium]